VVTCLVNALILGMLALKLLASGNDSCQFCLQALILVGERLILLLLVHGCAVGQRMGAGFAALLGLKVSWRIRQRRIKKVAKLLFKHMLECRRRWQRGLPHPHHRPAIAARQALTSGLVVLSSSPRNIHTITLD